MKRALQAARAFSQQALRQEAPASGRGVSGASRAPPIVAKKPLELDGRSYLLPTLALSRTAARKLGEAHVNFQTRARKTPIVLDLQMVSSDGALMLTSDIASVYTALEGLCLTGVFMFVLLRLSTRPAHQEARAPR